MDIADLPPRIAAKITRDSETGCWLWTASRGPRGYGQSFWQGKVVRAHRLVYTLLVGPIPPGLELDHVRARGCQHRHCVWPGHLEPVTRRENILRGSGAMGPGAAHQTTKTACPHGHPYDDANTLRSGGKRYCRECSRIRQRRRYHATK